MNSYVPYGVNINKLVEEAIRQRKAKSTHVISSDGSEWWELHTPSTDKCFDDMELLASGFNSFKQLMSFANKHGIKTSWIKKTIYKFPTVKEALKMILGQNIQLKRGKKA